MDHLSAPTLDALTAQRLPRAQARPAVLHLLACSRCQDRLLELYPFQGRLLLERLLDEPPERLEGALRQTRMAMEPKKAWALRETERAAVLFAELEPLSPAHRRLRALNSSRFANLSLVARLLEESRKDWHSEPEEAERWASLACALVTRVRQHDLPKEALTDIAARAWSYLGNSWRVLSSYSRADEALSHAAGILKNGSGDLKEQAEHRQFFASLRTLQARFDEGRQLTLQAQDLYRRAGIVRGVAHMQLALATQSHHRRRSQRAVEDLQVFFRRYSRTQVGDGLYFMAMQNHVNELVNVGQTEAAADLLRELRRSSSSVANAKLLAARLNWTEALVAMGRERLEIADRILRQVRQALDHLPCDRALAGLDLSKARLKLGNRQSAVRLALESEHVLAAHGMQHLAREAAAVTKAASTNENPSQLDGPTSTR